MTGQLRWWRVTPGEYTSHNEDTDMRRVADNYVVTKGDPQQGGGWNLSINGEWYSSGSCVKDCKEAAWRHYNLIVKYGTADQNSPVLKAMWDARKEQAQ